MFGHEVPLLPGSHVVFWEQRDLQHLRTAHHFLLAAGGDHLPRHPVDLVEGMRAKVSLVRSADEQQQADRLLAVSSQLRTHIKDTHQRHACDNCLSSFETLNSPDR